jgi:sigma-B regulation protein RsbU (phosphoserine phosphatase)
MAHNSELEKYYEGRLQRKQAEMDAVLRLANIIQQNNPDEGFKVLFTPALLHNLGVGNLCLLTKTTCTWIPSHEIIKSPSNSWSGVQNALDGITKITQLNSANHSQLGGFQWAIPLRLNNEIRHLLLVSMVQELDEESHQEVLNFLQTITGMLMVSVQNQQLTEYKIRQESIRQEIEIASQVQNLLFPKQLPNNAELQLYASYLPQLGVSGDYYDFIEIDEHRFVVCVADVSGKGVPAALLMSNFQATLRTLVKQGLHLNQIISKLNDILCENSNLERFITAFLAIIDRKTQTIHYINAGHNPPLLIDENGSMQNLTKGTTILGVLNPLPFINEDIIKLKGTSLLAAYTDGLTETDNLEGEEFGSDRVEQYFSRHYNMSLPDLHHKLTQTITDFCGPIGFKDDITILTCRIRMPE